MLVYDASGHNNERILGINYDAYRRTHRIAIDIENPFEQRNIDWVNEVYRILLKYRRAGSMHGLNCEWDYILIGNDTIRPNYTGFFQTVLEITLVKEVRGIEESGFGDDQVPNPEDVEQEIQVEI